VDEWGSRELKETVSEQQRTIDQRVKQLSEVKEDLTRAKRQAQSLDEALLAQNASLIDQEDKSNNEALLMRM
jgi:uncharacterized coiled-coil protein SlyX